MSRLRLKYLYQQYLSNNYTVEELQEFKLLLNQPENQADLQDLIDYSLEELPESAKTDILDTQADIIYKSIISKRQPKKAGYYLLIAIAASALLFLSIAFLFKINPSKNNIVTVATDNKVSTTKEALPGGNKAILTFDNGEKVILDNASVGQIAKVENVIINKKTNGYIEYVSNQSGEKLAQKKIQYNTITIPKGGQYRLSLPDGTQIYLNSESSLTYPISFSGHTRKVALTGEAYFEVAKNPRSPFVVDVAGKQKIEVLGTHFNVQAYDEENVINTTLLEGSVKILSDKKEVLLKPGQMAISQYAQLFKIKQANIEEVMAWKNGLFIFNNESITSIMRKISRWYNVKVVYKGSLENINFTGNYSRSKSLNNLLKSMELMNKVRFNIEERRITIIGK